jgi:hypothetical protein
MQTKVRVDLGFTRNMGNYESLRVDIGVEDFVRDGESVDAATDRVYEFVESKVIEHFEGTEKELQQRRGK